MKGILSVFIGVVVFSVSVNVLYVKGLDKEVGPYGEFWKPIPTQKILGALLFLYAAGEAKRDL